jgi:hypothetical protein
MVLSILIRMPAFYGAKHSNPNAMPFMVLSILILMRAFYGAKHSNPNASLLWC